MCVGLCAMSPAVVSSLVERKVTSCVARCPFACLVVWLSRVALRVRVVCAAHGQQTLFCEVSERIQIGNKFHLTGWCAR